MKLYWKCGLAFAVFSALVSGCLMYGRQEYRRGEIAATARISVEKIVEKPVYRGDCLDDDGVRIINEAIAHGN